MQVHIFRGQGRVFGFTEDKAAADLPSRYGPWIDFKTVEMNKGVATPGGVSTDECLDDIERYGYHLTDAHVRITERDLKALAARAAKMTPERRAEIARTFASTIPSP